MTDIFQEPEQAAAVVVDAPAQHNVSFSPPAFAAHEPSPTARGTVTMGKPLLPWGGVLQFHQTMALHIDAVTSAASRGRGLLYEEDSGAWLSYVLGALALTIFSAIVWRFV